MAGGTAGRIIQYKDIPGVVSGYKLHNSPYYALYDGKQPLFTYDSDDADGEGLELLQQNIEVIKNNGSTALLTMKFYKELDKNGHITKASSECSSFNFRLCEPGTGMQTANGGNGFDPAREYFAHLRQQNEMLQYELGEMRETLEEMKEEQDEADKSLGMIGKLEGSDLKDMVKEGMTFLRELFFQNRPGYNMQQQQHYQQPPQRPAHGIAGVNENKQSLTDALKELSSVYIEKHGEAEGNQLFVSDMCKLAYIARNKPVSFKNAIEQLREL